MKTLTVQLARLVVGQDRLKDRVVQSLIMRTVLVLDVDLPKDQAGLSSLIMKNTTSMIWFHGEKICICIITIKHLFTFQIRVWTKSWILSGTWCNAMWQVKFWLCIWNTLCHISCLLNFFQIFWVQYKRRAEWTSMCWWLCLWRKIPKLWLSFESGLWPTNWTP